jgi:DNA-binding winged helix-turn-helix (wHTH) protein/Tol biopolymer transport system component
MVASPTPDLSDFTVGDFTILTGRNLVIHHQTETSITPKMLLVLCELAKHQGQTLSKEQLFAAAWGTTVTTDMVLSRAIADLRKVFNDSAQKQHFIETVSKKGYRLKAPVKWISRNNGKSNSNKWLLLGFIILGTITTAIAAFFFFSTANQNSSTTFVNAPQLENLTSDHERERRVRFSPDGQSIVYSKTDSQGQNQQLFMHALNNHQKSAPVALAPNSGSDELVAAFSPDGQKIAIRGYNGIKCQITIQSVSTQIQESSVECPSSSIHSLDWSPDGTFLVTTKLDLRKKKESLVLLNAASGEFVDLSYPEFDSSGYLFPRYSPDGKKIAVIFLRPSSNLWMIGLVDSESGAFSSVFQSEQKINQVVWGSSSEELFFALDSGTRSGLWKMNLLSGEQSHILNGKIMDLDYSRETNQFVFTQQNLETSIWKTSQSDSPNSEVTETLIVDSTYKNSEPRLSPDNQSIAYLSTRSGIDSIWIKNLINGQARSVFKLVNSKITDISWSPDNTTLAFTLVEKDRSRIIFIDLESNKSKEFNRTADTSKGKWSTDSRHFYWMEKSDNLWVLKRKNSLDQSVEDIFSKPLKHYIPASDDNIYYQEILSRKVYIYNTKSKRPASEVSFHSSHFNSWDVSNGSFYFTTWSPERKRTYLYRSDKSLSRSVELFPINIAYSTFKDNLSIASSGSTAYYSKLTKLNYDVILMSH